MSNEDREALQAAILDTLKRWRLSALDVKASQIALRVRDEGFHRTPAPAPDVRALIHEARALVARADAWKRPGFPTEASEFVDALSDKVDRLTDALEAACATIAQLTTELDARFEHSDHTAAKYYRRMRDAEKEARMRRSESADFERERDAANQRAQAAGNAIADALAWMDAGDGRLHGHPLRRILSTYEQKGTN